MSKGQGSNYYADRKIADLEAQVRALKAECRALRDKIIELEYMTKSQPRDVLQEYTQYLDSQYEELVRDIKRNVVAESRMTGIAGLIQDKSFGQNVSPGALDVKTLYSVMPETICPRCGKNPYTTSQCIPLSEQQAQQDAPHKLSFESGSVVEANPNRTELP